MDPAPRHGWPFCDKHQRSPEFKQVPFGVETMTPVVRVPSAFRINRGRELLLLVDIDEVIAGSHAEAEHIDPDQPRASAGAH